MKRSEPTKIGPWNPVRVEPTLFRCDHCNVYVQTKSSLTVRGFLRVLRRFERAHNACAPAARKAAVNDVAQAAIQRAMGPSDLTRHATDAPPVSSDLNESCQP
jgi:hypothetical protein